MEIVDFLIARCADVNIQDNDGDTLLHYRCYFRHNEMETIVRLIPAGVDGNIQNNMDFCFIKELYIFHRRSHSILMLFPI